MRTIAIVVAVASSACSADVPNSEVPGPGPGGSGTTYLLESQGPAQVSLTPSATTTVQVRYLDQLGQPARGDVLFAIDGDPAGAQLSADSVESDSDGIAEVELTAGPTDADFGITASADYARTIEWQIEVTLGGHGDLVVRPVAEGLPHIEAVDVYLYEDELCEGLDPRAPAAADLLQSTRSVRDDVRFEALDIETGWTVFVDAIGESGWPVASGCVDETALEGGETVIEVPLAAVPVALEGELSVESHYLVADALPEDVLQDLASLEGLTDDPAGELLDRIEDLIDDGFTEFAYDAARFGGGLDMSVDGVIFDFSPDLPWVLDDVDRALTEALEDVRIDSILAVEPIESEDEDAADADETPTTWVASHELVDVSVGLDGLVQRFPADRGAGFTDDQVDEVPITLEGEDQVRIAQHDFPIEVGTLLGLLVSEVVLAQLPGQPRDLEDLVGGLIPCYDVGIELEYSVGMGTAGYWSNLCQTAARAMGEEVDAKIRALDDRWDTLRLEGTGEALGLDSGAFDAVDDGEWTARLVGAGAELPIEATFEGGGR